MPTLRFKKNSTPYTLHIIFMKGGSLTDDEARELKPIKIRNIAQRIADLHNKLEEAGVESPLMVYDEPNERRTGTHARYFYKGTGCPFEQKPGARMY
ncbi:hypothetical protein ACM66T_10150 [Sulfurimonas sp. ST-25]|uniref:hypothetical protein n=1 Tax=Sulfurimonas sp. ST-25 TaxID=3400151 RepID=UPI003A897FDB